MMSYALMFLIIAVVLIGIEMLVLGFTVFWFLFFGLGALIASAAAWFDPSLSLASVTGIFLAGSIGVAIVCYPILKKWQNKPSALAGNDAVGQAVKVVSEITTEQDGKVIWSGADWPAQLAEGSETLEVGAAAKIVKLKGIRLIVSS